MRAAWAKLLLPLMPSGSSEVVDLGCGTGSLSVLLAEAGHHVRGVDLAARMVSAAAVTPLRDPALWGREISDERYLLVSPG